MLRPESVDELAASVKSAAEQGKKLKAVGSGHSFTGCAAPEQVMVRLDGLSAITNADQASGRVTVGAGTGLGKLNLGLAAFDLAMANLGDIDKQTISGAISTGTHGTGARLGGLATQIAALDLVTADGSLLHCSPEENADIFNAARVSVGALGVIRLDHPADRPGVPAAGAGDAAPAGRGAGRLRFELPTATITSSSTGSRTPTSR